MKPEPSHDCMHVLRKLVGNGDKTIGKAVLLSFLKGLQSEISEAELIKLLDGASQNSDGSVNYDQFLNWIFTAEAPITTTSAADHLKIYNSCDLLSSGNLMQQELTCALHALGLYPAPEQVEVAMHGKQPISFESFCRICLELSNIGCPRGPVSVPHGIRGLTLAQLENLFDAFIRSGWLSQRCEDFNSANAERIEDGTVHCMSINLYAICDFIVKPITNPESFEQMPKDRCEASKITHAPNHQCSYSELVNPRGVLVDAMISHYWGHPFGSTMEALRKYAEHYAQPLGKIDHQDVSFWICLFAINQHEAANEVGKSPEAGPFNAAISKSRAGMVTVLDDQLKPFQRIWCLYELQRAHDLQKEYQLITEYGLLDGMAAHPNTFRKRLMTSLEHVSAIDADASVEHDKLAIWYRIANPFVRHMYSFPQFAMQGGIHRAWFEQFDVRICSILAQPLFCAAMNSQDFSTAFRYIGFGAKCNAADLQLMEASGWNLGGPVQSRFATDCTLVHVMAYFGSTDNLRFLLERGLDAGTRDSRGFTALHSAARQGHVEAAKCLLASGVDVTSAGVGGCTCLHRAAYAGHCDMVKLLLENGASLEAKDSDGWTPVYNAVVRGHHAVVKLMLRWGFSDAVLKGVIRAAQGQPDMISLLTSRMASKGWYDLEKIQETMEDEELNHPTMAEYTNACFRP